MTDPADLRNAHLQAVRSGAFDAPTSGLCAGYAQANLVVLPAALAYDFLLFTQLNPKPCPLLGMSEPGDPLIAKLDVDVRTDAPRYEVFRDGAFAEERSDLTDVWREDLVALLLGCSFTFEHALLAEGLPVRHIAAGKNVPMYRTSIACTPVGPFSGGMVVSMRGVPPELVERVSELTGRFPGSHGGPVHVGDPAEIGIADIMTPDFGDAPVLETGDVPVFWACGVTPQAVVLDAKPELAIFHKPGHMIITAQRDAVV
ncbi:putative hydro-lyase [Oceanicaulis alexandrii]|uniref:putative hydro-lyase n=1 Tax=Oceanicaulis alexandrii TaxID=153233 RepID=UPI0035CF50DD